MKQKKFCLSKEFISRIQVVDYAFCQTQIDNNTSDSSALKDINTTVKSNKLTKISLPIAPTATSIAATVTQLHLNRTCDKQNYVILLNNLLIYYNAKYGERLVKPGQQTGILYSTASSFIKPNSLLGLQ